MYVIGDPLGERLHLGSFTSLDTDQFRFQKQQCDVEGVRGTSLSTLTHRNSRPKSVETALFYWKPTTARQKEMQGLRVEAVILADKSSAWQRVTVRLSNCPGSLVQSDQGVCGCPLGQDQVGEECLQPCPQGQVRVNTQCMDKYESWTPNPNLNRWTPRRALQFPRPMSVGSRSLRQIPFSSGLEPRPSTRDGPGSEVTGATSDSTERPFTV